MTKYLYFFIPVMFLHFSCKQVNHKSSDDNNLQKRTLNNISFNTKFAVSNKYWGTFRSNKDDTEYVYFANIYTDKTIKVFEINDSICKYKIPLYSILEQEKNGIQNINMVSHDTTIVLGKYSNTLYFLNRKGVIWKKLQLDSIYKTEQRYELSTSLVNKFVVNNGEILTNPYYFYQNDSIKEDWGNIEYVKLERKNRWDSPHFIKFSNIYNDNVQAVRGSYVYQYLFPYNPFSFYLEFNSYIFQGEYIYFSSVYTNVILKIDVKNLEIVDKFEIKSDYTNIGIPLIPIGDEIRNYQEEYLDYFYNESFIRSFYYNENTKCFYINVSLKNKENKKMQSEKNRETILLVYNQSFNKIDEFLVDNSKYLNSFLNTKNGFYIQKKSNNQNVSFERINISYKDIYPYHRIEKFFLKNNTNIDSVNAILVITNYGECMNCNRIFADYIKSYVNKKNVKIIITEEGSDIDISPFLNSNNVIFDFEEQFLKIDVVNGTSVIFLNNKQIDTIVNIKSSTFKEQLTFIENKI